MNLLAPVRRALGFSYDAVDDRGRRRSPRADLRSPDLLLPESKRRKLVATTRDLQRNMSIAAWAIRRHLDYVSTFSFQSRTGNHDLDTQIERLMGWWSQPGNCDVTGRHSLPRLIRMTEERAVVDGDVLLAKLSSGHLQPIEGDRLRNPSTADVGEAARDFVHGIELSKGGRPRRYAICDRANNGAGFKLKAILPARHVVHHGYFDRFDSTRGVSPLASGLNAFQDVYEAAEYALAKAKVSQLFGLKLTRQEAEPLAGVEGEGEHGDQQPYSFEFGKGPQVLDLDPGDDADFLESRTPSTEFASFCEQMIAAALKALDIPFSFFNESFTNYSGARQALLQYEQSAANKRQALRAILDHLAAWRLSLFIEDGRLTLPAGMTLGDVRWEWIAAGLPWIDPLKEIKADVAAIENGLASRQLVCKARGRDFFEVADQLAAEAAYLAERGLPTSATTDTTPTVTVEEASQ